MSKPFSPTREMYLKTIYHLETPTGSARTYQLAKELKVKPGTVTNTIAQLAREGLVEHEAYRGVKLTIGGRKAANRILRRHRLLERLLTDVLHLPWSKVHSLACELEHSTHDTVANAIDTTLKQPTTCPHGNPIPTRRGKVQEPASKPLLELPLGAQGTIVKVTDEDSGLLQYLGSLGVIPGTPVVVEEKAPFDGPLIVNVRGAKCALGRRVASMIYVRSV